MLDIKLRKLITIILLLTSIIASFLFSWLFYFKGFSLIFYLSFIIFCISIVFLIYYLFKPGLLLYASITALIFSILLPGIDLLYSYIKVYVNKPDRIIYSYKDAKGDPAAFKKWWNHVVDEWKNGPQKSIEEPDKKGILPFVYKPNSEAKFFDSTLRINNLGLRGKDISRHKGNNCFRIVALGESTTFGATIKPSDRPWPEVLQDLVNDLSPQIGKCIEVINAGTAAYDLKDNLERVRRDIIPLNPDLIISYHGLNGLRHLQAELLPRVKKKAQPRGSKILEDLEIKIANLRAPEMPFVKGIGLPRPLPELLKSQYAELYRQLIQLGRTHKFAVVLAPFNMAVTRESPDDVIDFYSGGFPEVRQYISAIEDHNVLVEAIARHEGALFWEVRQGINGAYDDDIFIDLVHFTQKGRDMMAKAMFQQLKPFLISTLGKESARGRGYFGTGPNASATGHLPSE